MDDAPGLSQWDDPGRVDQLKALWEQGLSTRGMAERMGTTPGAIASKREQLGLGLHPNAVHAAVQTQWDATRVAELRRLAGAGLTCREIAEHMKATLGSVRHACKRYGVGVKRRPPVLRQQRLSHGNYVPNAGTMSQALRRKKRAEAAGDVKTPTAGDGKKNLSPEAGCVTPPLDLTSGQCRWPAGGKPPATLFCAEPVNEGSSYCPVHHARAYQIGSNRR